MTRKIAAVKIAFWLDDNLLNIPMFMADYADKLIGMALKLKQKKF